MAVLVVSEAATRVLDELQANVTTDAPIATGAGSEMERHLNDAYAFLWEQAGGSVKAVGSATAWTAAQLGEGTVFGVLTDINEILHLYATTSAPQAITCTTTGSVNVSSTALFGNVDPGFEVSGTGITARTRVASVTDFSNLVLDNVATDSSAASRTFSPTVGAIELRKVELSKIEWRRTSTGFGTYAAPKEYAVNRAHPAIGGNINKVVLEYWPGVTGYYFPMKYVAQFSPVTTTTEAFDLNDLQSRDLVYLTAISVAPLIGRAEFVPKLEFKLSEGTRLAYQRKQSALQSGKQDQ